MIRPVKLNLNSTPQKANVQKEQTTSAQSISVFPKTVAFGAEYIPSLMAQFVNKYNVPAPVPQPVETKVAETQAVQQPQQTTNFGYKNNLRDMLQNNEAVIMGIVPRLMGSKDDNNDDYISKNEIRGNLINAVDKLDGIKALGVNTLHVLPIHQPGKDHAYGVAGSLYAPLDFLQIDPALKDPNDSRTVDEQFKYFVDEAHKRGLKVMLDLPSCASLDLYKKEKENLMAVERNGNPKTPQGWNDIRMLGPWTDETKRELNSKLIDLHKKYIDKFQGLGIDGIRADVSRAKPTEFWDVIIPYSRQKDPQFAWLAETYTYEDASPQLNMNADRPIDALRAGFDSFYGQYHLFPEWTKAKDLTDYVIENLEMSKGLDKGKSMIGSFGTHDDETLMFSGGANFQNLVTGIQATLPMTNPYFVQGYESGDTYTYKYANKYLKDTNLNEAYTDQKVLKVHHGKLDIFNNSRCPGGNHPEIGKFMTSVLEMRKQHKDVLTKGSFIPLKVEGNPNDQIISYARHYNGKTLLVVANRNVNRRQSGKIIIPSLREDQKLNGLLPKYSDTNKVEVQKEAIAVDLAPSRIQVYEIDTPHIEISGVKVYKQNI